MALVLFSGTKRTPKSTIVPMILLGILNPGISYTLSLIGLAYISASVSTLLWAAEPLMILALAALILREPVTWRLITVILIGAFAVALVTDIRGGVGNADNHPFGILLFLLAVLCCAFYTVFARKLSAEVHPIFALAVQQAAGLSWALAVLFVNTPYGAPSDLLALPLGLAAAAALSGLLYYTAAYWLYITALRYVPAAVAGSYFNVVPIFGVGLAFVFLGETLTPIQWAGAVVLLVSVFELVRLTDTAEASQPG
jgi:drug/metabolite transporter (DMT)-like permease